jgi:hypothetical protein
VTRPGTYRIVSKVAKGHWRMYEVPIAYRGWAYARGKKSTEQDGLTGRWCLLRYNLCG